MGLKEFAKTELEFMTERMEEDDGPDDIQYRINEDIMELVETFAEQNHSGMSANYVLEVFNSLARYKPITPLSGAEDEWMEVDHPDGVTMQQNKRRPSVFRKNKDNGTAYDIDAVTYSDDGGETFFTGGGLPFKNITFPYAPPAEPERVLLDGDDNE